MKKQIKTKLDEYSRRRNEYASIQKYYKDGMPPTSESLFDIYTTTKFFGEMRDFLPENTFNKVNWNSPIDSLKVIDDFLGYHEKED